MTGTNHFLAGALIATAVPLPVAAVSLAFASHIVLDALPHFGRAPFRAQRLVILFDAAALVMLMGVVWEAGNRLVLGCGLVATSLDLLWLPLIHAQVKGRGYSLNRLQRVLSELQWGERPWGLLIELPFAGVLVVMLLQRL